MTTRTDPNCDKCNSNTSVIWRKEIDSTVCNDCFMKVDIHPKIEETDDEQIQDAENSTLTSANDSIAKEALDESMNDTIKKEDNDDTEMDICKSLDKREQRSRKSKRNRQTGKGNVPKGKGRRYIFKKSATKAYPSVSTPITSEYLFHKGWYYQVGDIVSVIDIDGGTYYAQIRGLLQDQYCEKSAVLTWLIPTTKSPPPETVFDPATYIIGPEEDLPRKLDYMKFVLRAPSDYFHDKTSPYATFSFKPHSCFVWSRMGPVIKPIENASEGFR